MELIRVVRQLGTYIVKHPPPPFFQRSRQTSPLCLGTVLNISTSIFLGLKSLLDLPQMRKERTVSPMKYLFTLVANLLGKAIFVWLLIADGPAVCK